MPITSSPLNAIQKACGILRALSAKAPLRLSEITAAAGLNKVTTLRILDTLQALNAQPVADGPDDTVQAA